MSVLRMNVPRETLGRLDAYIGLLRHWNRTLNLVSPGDLAGDIGERHIAQSLSLIPYIPEACDRLVDLGSGGGFPAIPIAIATGHHVDLVESDKRKAAFLQTTLATLGLSGTVWAQRIECSGIPASLCVTARALAPLPQLLAYAHPLLHSGGTALFLKGARVELELEAAQAQWAFQSELIELDHTGSRLLKISRLERAHDPKL